MSRSWRRPLRSRPARNACGRLWNRNSPAVCGEPHGDCDFIGLVRTRSFWSGWIHPHAKHGFATGPCYRRHIAGVIPLVPPGQQREDQGLSRLCRYPESAALLHLAPRRSNALNTGFWLPPPAVIGSIGAMPCVWRGCSRSCATTAAENAVRVAMVGGGCIQLMAVG